MFTGLTAKLIAAGALLAILAAGVFWFGAHERGIGAAGVQAQWHKATAVQAGVVATATAESAAQVLDWTKQFSAIGFTYEANTHVHAPQIADTVASGVADGSIRLRDDAPSSCAGAVPEATARSRAADAAATQALADRVAHSIAAVRAGDDADARERQLREQVIALQGVLRAERQH